jgi:hypothetical protein
MTDQIADARPPTRAEQPHHERLRMLVDEGFAPTRDHAAIIAGAAALEEVATLRAERDTAAKALAEMRFNYDLAERWGWRPDVAQMAVRKAETESVALRARVQHLTEALKQVPEFDQAGSCTFWRGGCRKQYNDEGEHWEFCPRILVAALTPPASTEGR